MKNILSIFAVFCSSSLVLAQVEENSLSKNHHFFNTNIDYQIKSNFSIGGSTPLGMPREIREIESFNPTLALGLETNATKWFSEDKRWGLRLGLRVEGKGMKSKARVKNYFTEVSYSNEKIKGYFTGRVETYIKNTYITAPISTVYKLSPKWNIFGGVYFSGLIDKKFNGNISDGYLRQDTPIGAKITFENDANAGYDFSEQVRKFQWGTHIGAEWFANKHLFLFSELSFGITPLLKSNFDAITFNMHNLYFNAGFGYQF